MEEGEIAGAARVAAIERVAPEQVEGAGDVAPAFLRHHQHDALGHALADEIEESARQIRVAPFAVRGRVVEAIERVPMARLDGAAGERLDLDAARERIAPLAPDLLALARIERIEESVEALVAVILPMELLADALQEPGRPEPLPFALRREGGADAGYLVPPPHFQHR